MALSDVLKKVDNLKEELNSLGEISSDNEKKLWNKLRLEWNYNSNHIEGNTLTYGETKLLLMFGQTNGNHKVRDLDEMRAHDVAVNLVKDWSIDNDYVLSERDIRDLNKTILVQDFWKDSVTPSGEKSRRIIKVGNYKEFPNSVITPTGELFEYASPTDTPILVNELIEWYRNDTADLHPVIVAATLHYRFVRIHPFDDGNGRISRLLMNYHLMRNGFPPIVIKSADKPNYFLALNRADTGDLDSFVEYVGKELLWSLELNIKAVRGEKLEEEDDFRKKVAVLNKKLTSKDRKKKQKKKNEKAAAIHYLKVSFPKVVERFYQKMSELHPLFESSSIYFYSPPSSNRSTTDRNIERLLKSQAIEDNLSYLLRALERDDREISSIDIKIEWVLNALTAKESFTISGEISLLMRREQAVLISRESSKDQKNIVIQYLETDISEQLNFINQLGNEILEKIEEQT